MAVAGSSVGGSMRIEGAAEIEKALKDLERKAARQIVRSSLRDGAKVVLAQAKANAPVLSGLTKSKLRVRVAKRRRGETYAVAVRTGEGAFKGKTFYASFVEFGHRIGKRPGRRSKSVDTRGTVPAHPFMQSAYDSTRTLAVDTVVASMRRQIEEAVTR